MSVPTISLLQLIQQKMAEEERRRQFEAELAERQRQFDLERQDRASGGLDPFKLFDYEQKLKEARRKDILSRLYNKLPVLDSEGKPYYEIDDWGQRVPKYHSPEEAYSMIAQKVAQLESAGYTDNYIRKFLGKFGLTTKDFEDVLSAIPKGATRKPSINPSGLDWQKAYLRGPHSANPSGLDWQKAYLRGPHR